MNQDNENDRLSRRLKRYARVSGSMSGLAVKLASERLFGLTPDRAGHAADLRRALGGLKGPLMKVAQMLATIPDALPPEYARELGQLQAQAPAMGWPFVKRRMKSELGADWEKRFKSFTHEAAAAASLGQVHRAVALDGRALACKLQYPDMRSAVEADLKQLKLIFALYARADKAIDPRHIHDEIATRLREELDYDLEGRHMQLFGHMLAGEAGVHVPQVVPELSTGRLLTMSWLEGAPLLSFKDAPQEQRDIIAMNLFHAWYVPFHHFGVIHGDPHLGNYSVRPDGSINLLDFGCVRVFAPKFVQGVIDLYRALETDDRALAVHAYETWGFSGLSNAVIDTLNIWAEFIYAPILDNRRRRIQEAPSPGVYGQDVAARVHSQLRASGTVTPPREFVFMDRAAIGLGGVFLHLAANINWHELFEGVIADFSLDELARRQKAALAVANVPEP